MRVELNNQTQSLYAIQAYNNPLCASEDEYKEDLARLTTLKRNLARYFNDNESVSLGLVVNSFIAFFNVFEHRPAVEMIFFGIKPELYGHAKAIIYFLNILPFQIETVDLTAIKMDGETYRKLVEKYE